MLYCLLLSFFFLTHIPPNSPPISNPRSQELPRLPFVFISTPYSLSSAAENREIIGMWAFERSLRGKLREELRPLLACSTVIAVPNSDESTYEKDEADGTSRHILGRSEWGHTRIGGVSGTCDMLPLC